MKAPHKAVLLITVINEIKKGYITNGIIPISDYMVNSFKEVWIHYIGSHSVFKPTFELPFFHLSREAFWKLIKTEYYQQKSSYSLNQLRVNFKHAQIDADLMSLLQDEDTRKQLITILEEKYLSINQLNSDSENKQSILITEDESIDNPSRLTQGNNPKHIVKEENTMAIKFVPKFTTFFDRLLQQRGLDECPRPLWRLKLKDSEYENLVHLLRSAVMMSSLGREPFATHQKECALFVAEYWRREYVDGAHSKQMLFDALNVPTYNDKLNYPELLYDSAIKGAKRLKLDIIENNGVRQFLDSLLYQGGLPMQKIITPETNSVWDRLADSIVRRNIDFDALENMLGIVARQSTSIREFCNILADAVDSKQFMKLPYWCSDENDPRYALLLERSRKVKREQRMRQPFSLDWEFDLQTLDKRLIVKYDISASQTLPDLFLEQYNLKGKDFFTASVRKDLQIVDSFDFINGFCRSAVRSKHVYHTGETIGVYIDDCDSALLSDSLNLDIPHLLYQTDNGYYKLGNRIGSRQSVILVNDEWSVDNTSDFNIKPYYWDGVEMRGIVLPDTFIGEVVVRRGDDTIKFNSNTVFFWTDIVSRGRIIPDIKESVYNAGETTFCMCYESGDTSHRVNQPVEFRNKWEQNWNSTPSYGEIYVRATHPSGEFVTETKLINVGESLSINVIYADENNCKIKVVWPYGRVSTEFGRKLIDDVWLISREDCQNSRLIPFTFTPTNDYRNVFTLNVKAPFKIFAIEDENGELVKSGSFVPYSDIDKYTYRIAGINLHDYMVGDKKCQLAWDDDRIVVSDEDGNKRKLPYEGALMQLLGNRESIRQMLDRTSENIIMANVPVLFNIPGGKSLSLQIKDSPFRIRQYGRKLTIQGNLGQVNYTRALKLFRLDNPAQEPFILYYDDENGYVMPDEVKDWGRIIATGRSRGRICPALVEYERLPNEDNIRRERSDAITKVTDEIESACFADKTWTRVIGWFNRSQNDDLPASSFLDLVCCVRKPTSLIKLAFQLYCETDEDDRSTLMNKLKYMSDDLAFQWFWILPAMRKGLLNVITGFMSGEDCLTSDVWKSLYVKWAIGKGEAAGNYLSDMGNDNYYSNSFELLKELVNDFKAWLDELCKLSMHDSYVDHSKGLIPSIIDDIISNTCCRTEFDNQRLIDYNQEKLDDEAKRFFMPYAESYKSSNEQWMIKRVNLIAKHLRCELDLFELLYSLEEFVADKVRRSIIFCYKSTQREFLFSLNNKLAK